MSFLLKNSVHSTLLESVYNDLLSRRSNYHYFVGKVIEWSDPSNPEAPVDTQKYEYDTRNNIISVKRVNITDASYVIRRIDWEPNEVYDQYDGNYSLNNVSSTGATSLQDADFYVLTEDFNVYKCLFNNDGALSTIKPTGTDLLPITTADGYVWKFMYTVPPSLRKRFLTGAFMPVQKSIQNRFYSDGQIENLIIDNNGSGYSGNTALQLTVVGEFLGGGPNANAILKPVLSNSGSFLDVRVENKGLNYRTANIVISDINLSGTSLYKNLSNIRLYDTGFGYDTNVKSNTTVVISTSGSPQPNSNAVVQLVYGNNVVSDINILNPGSGYTQPVISNTTVTISTSGVYQPTTNATANLNFATSAILQPVLSNNQIQSVLITDPGVSYSANISTLISTIGDGTGVSLLPYINDNGELEDVIILNRGNGYTYLDVQVVGQGTGANVIAELSEGDTNTLQSDVELSAIKGAIYAVRITNGGNNYSNANVTIVGDGTGFTANAVVSNVGTITNIIVSSPGVNYTYANVVITGDGVGANAEAILAPENGHGFNAVRELYSNSIMFYSTINNEKINGVDVNNDYRQFGIIKNLKQFANSRTFANVTGTSCYLVTLSTLSLSTGNTLSSDTVLELVSDTSRNFEVIEVIVPNNQVLLLDKNNYLVKVGDTLNDNFTDSNFVVTSVDKYPSIDKFSGEMIFIDNRTSISYSDQQLVTFRTVITL